MHCCWTMDAKEIIHHAKEIEKLHKNGNYNDISPLLSLLLDAHVSLEHLQNTDIAQILYRVVKSCPDINVRKTSKVLLSKWKKLHSHPQMHICRQIHAGESAKSKADDTELLNGPTFTAASSDSPRSELATGDAPSAKETGSQTHTENSSGIASSATPGEQMTRESSFQESAIKLGHVEAPSVNITSELCTVRNKCAQLLQQALSPEKDPEDAHTLDTLAALACNIESHIHAVHGTNMPKYKTCVRSKVANLRNPKCSHLRQGLLSGRLIPEDFARMSAEDMAGEDLRRERESYVAAGINECQLPRGVEGTRTCKLRCKRCQGMDCQVTQISRGTLFLPAWVRQGNPGEEAMTFVTCSGCGQQWYQSGWVCF
ncbi:transcription elongation factor A N-terminal and central domain-containing protein isoform X1 [Alosa sapidissima]|uniref:transcription elongation factor A N-terminal and central domain-containing protein isoform X1 n=2 Tax=Alosa sapidissima TaxID=34773 RepID=UPI001C0A4765|nr:transcription elongation factor A N-terminal and central domain-containing protein isoform X1 [Alosa sapidissima]